MKKLYLLFLLTVIMISSVNAACIDTDGGEVFDTKGTVTADIAGTNYDMVDSCLTDSELKEFYCDGDSSSFSMKQCNCVDGACSETGEYGYFWDVPNEEIESCVDTDGGQDYEEKGTITISAGGYEYSLNDNCYAIGHTITEYYCDGRIPKLKDKLCDCQDGVCYQEPEIEEEEPEVEEEPGYECSETDEGQNYYEKGVTTWKPYYDGDNGVGTDTCLDSNKLKEFFCSNLNQGDVATYICPEGCNVGACEENEEEPEVEIKYNSGSRVMGYSTARLRLIEWGDFQCPFCKRFFDNTFPLIKSKFIDTGMVKYEFRHYPLSFHPNAQRAAEAAECADDQGKFWEMHDSMFQNQGDLDFDGLIDMADKLSMDEDNFEDCIKSGKYENEVKDQMSDGSKQGVKGTPGFILIYKDKNGLETKVNIAGAQPFSKFEELIESAWRKEVYQEPGSTPEIPEQNQGKVSIDSDPYMGNKDAKVAIVEFADFECPFCARAHPTVKRIQNKYVKTGKVLFIYRDFPLSFHKNAKDAAVASECAFDQPNYYWKYHDELFSNQGELSKDLYIEIADDIGMDLDDFVDCYNDYNYESEVDADFKAGQLAGVKGTPSFFIGRLNGDMVNGEILVGAQPYENFETVIEKYLETDSVPDDEFCGDGICQINEKRYCNLDCPLYEDKPELKCVDGDSLYFECTDGEKLSWCVCATNEWECIDNPQESCDIQEGKCSGCSYADTCLPYGERMKLNEEDKYCGISSNFLNQKIDESSCQNDYECLSNQCSNGRCIDLEKELNETKGLLQRILDFLKNIF